MRLSSNDPIFDRVPAAFSSPFPSDAALLSEKFSALMQGIDPGSGGTIGKQIFTRANAQAWRDAFALVNKAKVTIAGDLPSTWLPRVAWVEQVRPGVEAILGLWAEIDFRNPTKSADFARDVMEAGVTTALNTVGAVPIVGIAFKFVLGLGSFVSRLFDSPAPIQEKRMLLPWQAYAKGTDEDIVQKFLIETYGGAVDWTAVFLPPFEADIPWQIGAGVQDGEVVGSIWAPIKGKSIAWSTEGIGAMPGTERVAGLVQSPDKIQVHDPRLNRYFSDGTMIRWGRSLTDTGDFLPATAQTSMLLWQQAQKAGSPDMYKIDLGKIETAWETYWGTFWESLWAAFKADEWAGEFGAPYLAIKADKWRLGLKRNGYDPIAQPQPAPFVTPTIFKEGPGTVLTRNTCSWVEPTKGPTYPYPEGSSSTAQLNPYPPPPVRHYGRIAVSGGPAWPPGSPMFAGAKCRGWPEPEDLLVKYSSPFEGIIKPAIDRLRALQEKCLLSTLVVAYVRVTEVQGMPAYAAFRANPGLKAKGLEARQMLLNHEARFQVRVKDVDDIDPDFADQLRASGVTNSPAQLQQAMGLGIKLGKGGAKGEDDLPSALPPMGGSPWDPGTTGGGSGGAGVMLAAAGLGALLLL